MPITPTSTPDVNEALDYLLRAMQGVLGDQLIGLYLFGSLVMGDFDEDASDIDLLAALANELGEAQFKALDAMQQEFLTRYPVRKGRLEIAYLSLNALKTYKTQPSQIGIISPGEPFHFKEAGGDWLVNWHIVREHGLTLYGPPPADIIAPSTTAEFVQVVKQNMLGWRDRISNTTTRPSQAYAILTLCRGLYTVTHGEQPSKRQAALWAGKEMPEWADLIDRALIWRKHWRDPVADPQTTIPETRRFVALMIDRISTVSPD